MMYFTCRCICDQCHERPQVQGNTITADIQSNQPIELCTHRFPCAELRVTTYPCVQENKIHSVYSLHTGSSGLVTFTDVPLRDTFN